MPKLPNLSRRNILIASAGTGVVLGGGYGALRLFNRPLDLDVIQSQPLPIPPLLNGRNVAGRKVFDLTMGQGSSTFSPGIQTHTLGYNGDLLGPTLHMQKGDDVVINVTNELGEATTTHWHGIHLPAKMDGGPYQIIENGATRSAQFTILNEAATYFYHPHLAHKTGEQIYRGLMGLFIIKDPQNEPVLPDQYGIDDIPLVVQDKSLNADGSLSYSAEIEGVKGDYIFVNGAITPTLEAPAQWVRFRVLNGANARVFNFGFSDNRQFYQIGTDGGLLAQPVALTRVLLSPAERAEILVNFSDQAGEKVRLLSYSNEAESINPFWARDRLDSGAFDVLTINVVAATANRMAAFPTALGTIGRLNEAAVSQTRKLELDFKLLGFAMTINGQKLDLDRIDQTVQLGDTEIWEISNPSPFVHPFHMHDIQFQILTRNGQPPPENERGWKDTVLINQDEAVRFIARFNDFADPDIPYMYHCHNLEHEDGGMMGQFLVV